MKKKILIIIGVILVIAASIGLYIYSHKDNDKTPTFDSEVERQEYIKKFVEEEEGIDPDIEINEHAGGLADVNIQNRGVLMKYGDPDIMLSVDSNISNAIKILLQISKDITDKDISEISKYFSDNESNIISILGIDNVNDFEKFAEQLDFIKDSNMKEALIDENTLTRDTNVITFNLRLKSEDNKEQVFKIKNIITVENNKANSVSVWQY